MLGPLAALGSSFTWAIGSSAYSPLSKKYSPLSVNLARAMAALPVFLSLITVFGKWGDFSILSLREVFWLVTGMVASYATGDALFLSSSQSLGVPGALAIASAYPIWSALAGVLFLGQALSLSRVLALATILGGVTLVIVSDMRRFGTTSSKESRVFGVAMAIVTSLFWSLNTYANAKVNPEVSSFVANSIRMSAALLFCTLFIFLTPKGRPRHFMVKRSDWKKFGWIFCLEGAGGSFFFVYGLTHSSLAVASVLSALAPAITVPMVWFMHRERLPKMKVLGVFVVVAGVTWLVSKSGS